MDNAGKIEAIFLLDGDDIPILTHGDEGILKIFLVVWVMQEVGKLILYPVASNEDARSKARELHRSCILDIAFFIKDAG